MKKVLRIGNIVKVNHKLGDKIIDSTLFYLDDLSIYSKKKSITRADWYQVKKSTKAKPKFEINENELFVVRNGKAFGYFRARIGSTYDNREKISNAIIVKVVSPISLRSKK
jgi:hypothetical protein